ncbi:hypothetical protein GCM10027436_58340 [Actinophytocola sediminis]
MDLKITTNPNATNAYVDPNATPAKTFVRKVVTVPPPVSMQRRVPSLRRVQRWGPSLRCVGLVGGSWVHGFDLGGEGAGHGGAFDFLGGG